MYETHFGLTEAPFNVTPDPRFFFQNACYQEAYATLCYGIEARKGVIVVTGEAGTGKTTLLRRLMQDHGSRMQAVYIFSSLVGFSELLKTTMNDLGVPPAAEDRAAMIEQFNDYLLRQLQLNNVVCLLIDEAQTLSDEILEEIRLLSNLETEREKLLQIVLMGHPELEQRLNQPQLALLKQRIVLRCRLRPLPPQEVGPYVDARLKTAGCRSRDLFLPEAIECIASYSKGIPRLINVICDNALLNAFGATKSRISADIIQEVAQELKLAGAPPDDARAPVSELQRAVGEDLFRPTRKREEPVVEKQVDPPRRDFPVGEDLFRPTRKKEEPVVEKQVDPPRWDFDFTIPDFAMPSTRLGARKSTPGWGRSAALLLLSVMVAGAAATFYSQNATLSLLRGRVASFAGKAREFAPVKIADTAPRHDAPRNKPLPSTEVLPPVEEPHRGDSARLSDSRVPGANHTSQVSAGNRAGQEPGKAERTKPPGRDLASRERPAEGENDVRRLKIKIYRAIHNRAIDGVDVYVNDGVVYLGGRVATQRQKRAAVRAAHSVSGVNKIRDRIKVGGAGARGRH